MSIILRNPTGRQTQAHIALIGVMELFFSYETLIAFRTPELSYRRRNAWGQTTGRHFNELGCGDFPVLEGSRLESMAEAELRAL